MAEVQRDSVGPFIQFIGPDKVRRKLRLTGMGDRDARRFADKLTDLRRFVRFGLPLDDGLTKWGAELDAGIADKLADYGLLPRRAKAEAPIDATIGPFVEGYLAMRSDVKGRTRVFYGQTQRNLVAYVGADKPLQAVSPGDADEFRLWLLRPKAKINTGGAGLSEATARRRCTLAAQFFRAAVRKGLISANPFQGVGGKVKSNKARVYFVTHEEVAKTLAACPNDEWRLLFSLARYGGLRTPSEHRGLKWSDFDWARNKFLVHSPKTEHHEGGDCRWVPIFPELRPLLDKAFHEAEPGAVYVIPQLRNQENLGTHMARIIKRAGLKPWPKLFHNLRSTRQTELAASFPLHKVCAWLGNKAAIAQEHYLQITDDDFNQAASAEVVHSWLHGGAFLAQTRTDVVRHDSTRDKENAVNDEVLRVSSNSVEPCLSYLVGGKGLEPLTPSV